MVNDTFGNMLLPQVKSFGKWHVVLPKIKFEFNSSKNRSTWFFPFEILLGKNTQGPLILYNFRWGCRNLYMHGLKISLLFKLKHVRIWLLYMRDAKLMLIDTIQKRSFKLEICFESTCQRRDILKWYIISWCQRRLDRVTL